MPLSARRSPTTAKRANLLDYPFDVHYGISRLGDRITTPSKYFWSIKNGYVTKLNWVEQRNGFSRVTTEPLTGSPKIRKIFEYENKTGGRTIVGRGGSRWARLSGTTWTDIDTGRGADVKGQCAQFNNDLYLADGGELRKVTSAFAVSTPSASQPSTVSCVHTHRNRLVTNDDSDFMAVEISKVGSVDFTGSGDHLRLNLSQYIAGGDRVIGFDSFANQFLIIWMTRHVVIYSLSETYAEISLQQILSVGCVSYDGIIREPGKEGDIWFPSETGYLSLKQTIATSGTASLEEVTTQIGPYYRSSLKTLSDLSDICGVFYQRLNHGYFNFPFTSNPEVWVISKDLQTITKGAGNIAGYFDGIAAHSFCERKSGQLYFGGNDGHLYLMDDGTNDNGSAISFEAEKTGLYFGNPKIYKGVREFEALLVASASLTAYLDYSYGVTGLTSGVITEAIVVTTQAAQWDAATSLWDQTYWDAAGYIPFKSRNVRGRGKVFSARLRHSTLNAKIAFPYWIFSLYNMGDK